MTRPTPEDLLGDTPPETKVIESDWAQVRHAGVGIDWLSGAFEMDRRKVRVRLAGCPIMEHRKAKSGTYPVYRLRDAAAYLVPGHAAVAEAIRNMNSSDLPPDLQKDVWDARLKEIKWREQAGELWRTSDVTEVLAETFKVMRQSIQLWADGLEAETDLPPEVRSRIIEMSDQLQAELHQRLVEMPKLRQTLSVESDHPRVRPVDDDV